MLQSGQMLEQAALFRLADIGELVQTRCAADDLQTLAGLTCPTRLDPLITWEMLYLLRMFSREVQIAQRDVRIQKKDGFSEAAMQRASWWRCLPCRRRPFRW